MKVIVEHLGRPSIVFPISSPDHDLEPSNPIPVLVVAPPPHDEATDLP